MLPYFKVEQIIIYTHMCVLCVCVGMLSYFKVEQKEGSFRHRAPHSKSHSSTRADSVIQSQDFTPTESSGKQSVCHLQPREGTTLGCFSPFLKCPEPQRPEVRDTPLPALLGMKCSLPDLVVLWTVTGLSTVSPLVVPYRDAPLG